jgi:hypothetical protein
MLDKSIIDVHQKSTRHTNDNSDTADKVITDQELKYQKICHFSLYY